MRYTLFLFSLLLVSYASADEPKVADKSNAIVAELLNQVEELRNQGQAAVARTETLFDEEVAKLKAKAMESLSAEMDAAIEAKDLDRAVALRELVKKVEGLNAGDVTEATIVIQPQEADKPEVKKPAIPKDAVRFGGHHYKIVTDKVTWMQARNNAQEAGGHLIQINSSSEYNFVADKLTPQFFVWIDGSRLIDGIYRFEDGKPVDLEMFPNAGIEKNFRTFLYLTPVETGLRLQDGAMAWDNVMAKMHYIIEWDE